METTTLLDLQPSPGTLSGSELMETVVGGTSVSITTGQVAQLSLSASALDAQSRVDTLAGQLALPTGSTTIGDGIRTQSAKNADVISVRDYITTTIDGTTSNQAGIVAAVAAAFAAGSQLYWPPGDYVVTGAVPNFYGIRHVGSGRVKDGANFYPITAIATSSITLNVATTGDDTNLGINSSRPLKTIAAAIAAIPQNAVGTWTIQIAAGTYAEPVAIRKAYSSNLTINVKGPVATPNTQTAIVDGAGLGSILPGFYAEGLSKINVNDILVQNFTNSGINVAFCGLAQLTNTKCFNTGTASAENVRSSHSQLIVNGCQVDGNNASTYGYVCYHGFMSVLGASTATNCIGAGALYAEASGGHFDTNIVTNCPRGIYALQGGFPTVGGGSITGSTTCAIDADQGSYIVITSLPTLSGNTLNIRQTVNFGIGGKLRDETSRTAIFANNDALDIVTQSGSAFMMQLSANGLTVPQGTFNGRHLVLGTYHIWVSATGVLRINNGLPGSDGAGVAVGSQT